MTLQQEIEEGLKKYNEEHIDPATYVIMTSDLYSALIVELRMTEMLEAEADDFTAIWTLSNVIICITEFPLQDRFTFA